MIARFSLGLLIGLSILTGNVWAAEKQTRSSEEGSRVIAPLQDFIVHGLRGSSFISRTYLVQPGDVLSVHLWGEYNAEYLVTVSAEGEIYVPFFGELSLSGLSLAEVESLIQGETAKYYKHVHGGVSLMAGKRSDQP